MKAACLQPPGHRQRGVYAIEFAMVFLIFFTFLYAIICYGLLFAFRMGLQNAAEDGARAALRYQASYSLRSIHARDVAAQSIQWLPGAVNRAIDATVCGVVGNNCAAPVCGPTWDARCQMVVTVTATNMRSMLPPLPNFAIPDQIVGKASMLLDGRAP